MKARLFVHLLLILILGLLLSGCGSDTSTPTTSDDTAVEAADQETVETEDTTVDASDASAVDDSTATAVASAEPTVVVTVNGSPGYSDALETAYSSIYSTYYELYAQFGMDVAGLLQGPDGLSFDLSLESQALERVILEVIIHDEAEARGVSISEDDILAEFDNQYADYLGSLGWTNEEFVTYVESTGTSFDEFKASVLGSIEWQLLLDVMQVEIAGPVELTDEELQAYFDENLGTYSTEEQIMASHILVATQTEAEIVLADLDAGEEFATLARERSLDTGSAAAGGNLGWFGRGVMVEPFETAAFATEVGTYSDVVQSDYGYHIILVTDHQDAHTPGLDEVVEQVTADLTKEKQFELLETWYDEKYAEADIAVTSPLVAAYRLQSQDINAALEAFEQILEEGSAEEPYLPYLIATIYADFLSDAQTAYEGLIASDEITEEIQSQIDAAAELIAEYRETALEYFRMALANVGGEDTTILLQIETLEAAAEETEPGTDTETDTE